MIVKWALVVGANGASNGMGPGALPVDHDFRTFVNHVAVALLPGFQPLQVLHLRFDGACSVGVNQSGSENLLESGNVAGFHRQRPSLLGTPDLLLSGGSPAN